MHPTPYNPLADDRLSAARRSAIIEAVLTALHQRGVPTWHMAPAPLPVELFEGPTTLTVELYLREPERDLDKALGLGPTIHHHLAQALGASDHNTIPPVRLQRGEHSLLIELPHPTPQPLTLSDVQAHAQQLLHLGLDPFGEVVMLDLWQSAPGVLVSGRPGSGRRDALRTISVQALVRGWELHLIAAQEDEAERLSSWSDIAPHCAAVAVTESEVAVLLAALDQRLAARAAGEEGLEPALLLIVAELSELTPTAQSLYARLARLRHRMAFRTVAGTRALSEAISSDVRAALPTRLIGATDGATPPGLGLHALAGRGDMLLVRPGGRTTRCQVARADAEDVAPFLRQLSPPGGGVNTVPPPTNQTMSRSPRGTP